MAVSQSSSSSPQSAVDATACATVTNVRPIDLGSIFAPNGSSMSKAGTVAAQFTVILTVLVVKRPLISVYRQPKRPHYDPSNGDGIGIQRMPAKVSRVSFDSNLLRKA